jgi:hypothetical protein
MRRQRRRWEDGIRMDLREIGWGSVDWIQLAQDRDRWRALVNTVMNLRVMAPRSLLMGKPQGSKNPGMQLFGFTLLLAESNGVTYFLRGWQKEATKHTSGLSHKVFFAYIKL